MLNPEGTKLVILYIHVYRINLWKLSFACFSAVWGVLLGWFIKVLQSNRKSVHWTKWVWLSRLGSGVDIWNKEWSDWLFWGQIMDVHGFHLEATEYTWRPQSNRDISGLQWGCTVLCGVWIFYSWLICVGQKTFKNYWYSTNCEKHCFKGDSI